MRALPLLLLVACGNYPVLPDSSTMDMTPLANACDGWGCSKDEHCPPTLCYYADRMGRCASGTCVWRTP
jgi:hypothetical protein